MHSADCEPRPDDFDLLEAWAHFHNGQFEEACLLGLALGDSGMTVANMAACVYASQLPPQNEQRMALCQAVSERAATHVEAEPGNPNAHYLLAISLARYGDGLSVTRGLAQGLGSRIKDALEKTISLQPRHADAHFALGAFHADIIDKVGTLIAQMTYGARREASLDMFEKGFALQPRSPFGLVEYGQALCILDGDGIQDLALALYRQAAGIKPLDAPQYLGVQQAKKRASA